MGWWVLQRKAAEKEQLRAFQAEQSARKAAKDRARNAREGPPKGVPRRSVAIVAPSCSKIALSAPDQMQGHRML